MKKLFRQKTILGNIVIAIGVLFVIYSIYTTVQIKLAQDKRLAEYNEPSAVQVEEEPVLYLEDEEKKEVKAIEATGGTDRSSITDLKMIIEIPKIKVNAAVVNGTTPKYLKEGPGLYEISPLPDSKDSNVLIAGHRTTYGAWFRKVDKLEEGDEIILRFDENVYNYKVEKVFTIAKNDWSVTEPVGYSALTLTSCHPPGSSRQRIVVRARLDSIIKDINP